MIGKPNYHFESKHTKEPKQDSQNKITYA